MENERQNYPLNLIPILDILKDTIKIFNSTIFFDKNIKISPKSITILKKQINYDEYDKKYIILIGKGIYGLIKYLNKNLIINNHFTIIALVSDKTKIETDIHEDKILIQEGNHPIPKEKSIESTKRIINIIKKLEENDLVIFFISGGSSSLFCYPNPIYSRNEFSQIWEDLLYSSLSIHEINYLRGKIDLVKKGGIFSFTKSKIISFYLSDVVGDNLSSIGSGPTIIDHEILNEKNFIKNLPKSTVYLYEKIQNSKFDYKITKNLISNNLFLSQLDFAKELSKIAEVDGYRSKLHLPAYIGSYKEVCYEIISYFKNNYENNNSNKKILNIWSGEPVVEVSENDLNGIGGRNQHLLLFLFKLWIENELPSGLLISFATDGIDGNSPYAGGWINTQESKKDLNSINRYLNEFNSSSYLKPDNFIKTGVTGINFADIIIINLF